IYVNQVGGNDELIFDGRSIVVDGVGNLVARARAFEEDLIVFDLDISSGPGKINIEPGLLIAESPEDVIENVYMRLVLGTRDYMRKCGFKKAVIGLSGGIDSALTATIAVQAAGAENVMGVAMPSPYSSEHSIADARQLAANLGIGFCLVPIEKAMHSYKDMLA